MSAKKLWIRVFSLGVFSVMMCSENINDDGDGGLFSLRIL